MIEEFIRDGFVRLDGAFPRSMAEAGREILWRDLGCDPLDRSTWTKPVIRLGDYGQEPFERAVNTPVLHEAFDGLVGVGKWLRRSSLGTFPVRFPSAEDPGDAGWHTDASFAGADGSWRINLQSSGRALLMLFLFSDVGDEDAPTRIRVGSHLDVPRMIEPFGDEGVSVFELAPRVEVATAERREVPATGEAGTVYLCHPFLVHAAQGHRGSAPRFMAQPPLYPSAAFRLDGESPVERAIAYGLRRVD